MFDIPNLVPIWGPDGRVLVYVLQMAAIEPNTRDLR